MHFFFFQTATVQKRNWFVFISFSLSTPYSFSDNEFYQRSRLFFCSLFMNVNADTASHHLEIEKVLQVNTQLLQIIWIFKITAWIGQYSETATRTNQSAHGEHMPLSQCSSTSCSSLPGENVRCQKCCVPLLLVEWQLFRKVKFCSFEKWAQSTITSSRAPWVQTGILPNVSPILRKKNKTQRRAWGRSTTSPNCADMNSREACCASMSQATFSIFRKINEQAHPQTLPRLL